MIQPLDPRSKRQYADLQGLGRAMAIVEQLADHPMRAKELAEALGIKWTTAYRTLAYLCDHGYLYRDPVTGVYSIGARLFSIGSSYVASHPIVQAARPYLKEAVDETDTIGQLVQRDRYRAVALLALEASSESIPKTAIGFHFPLHCGSKGRVLLAYESRDFVDEYLARPLEMLTPHTVTDSDLLRAVLAEIREQGYAVTRRDVQLHTGSVAAPVFDSRDVVIASLSLIANFSDLEEREARLVDAVLQAARSVSLLMGWRPPLSVRAAASPGG
jgi:DNA-binding IclR family transcriptional regulator